MNWHNIEYGQIENKEVHIHLPASKSISNRLLILQYLSSPSFEIEELSKANDTILLKKILDDKELRQDIFCQDAGTALRFITSLCASYANKTFTIRGTDRLLERPMQALFDCLNQLGAQVKLLQTKDGAKFISVQGAQLKSTPLTIAGNVSSQFISGLCLIAPQIENGIDLTIEEPILSRPYIEMTLSLMRELGIDSTFEKNHISIPAQKVQAKNLVVEADWSSACFFYSLMILSEKTAPIYLYGLREDAIQGDQFIADLAEQFGIKTTYGDLGANLRKEFSAKLPNEIDLEAYPDLAVPLIVACAFKYPQITFKGLEHLKLKESNRVYALQENLEKFGILLHEEKGRISFEKKTTISTNKIVKIHTHADHRIAMSFALVATLGHSIALDNIECINKSFPDFFEQMNKLGIRLKK